MTGRKSPGVSATPPHEEARQGIGSRRLELQTATDRSIGVDSAAAPNRQTGAAALPVGLPDKSNWNSEHVDVRDDRIGLFGDVAQKKSTFVYRIRATNAGLFQATVVSNSACTCVAIFVPTESCTLNWLFVTTC